MRPPEIKLGTFDAADEDDDLGTFLPKQPNSKAKTDNDKAATSDTPATPRTPAPSRKPKQASAKPKTNSRKQPTTTRPAPKPGVIRSTTIHLPYETHQRLLAHREQTGYSNGTIVKMALEQTVERLTELIGARATVTGSLFTPVPSHGSRPSPAGSSPRVALNARFYEADIAVIDGLVETHGAVSRGHLITTALNAYLP